MKTILEKVCMEVGITETEYRTEISTALFHLEPLIQFLNSSKPIKKDVRSLCVTLCNLIYRLNQ